MSERQVQFIITAVSKLSQISKPQSPSHETPPITRCLLSDFDCLVAGASSLLSGGRGNSISGNNGGHNCIGSRFGGEYNGQCIVASSSNFYKAFRKTFRIDRNRNLPVQPKPRLPWNVAGADGYRRVSGFGNNAGSSGYLFPHFQRRDNSFRRTKTAGSVWRTLHRL